MSSHVSVTVKHSGSDLMETIAQAIEDANAKVIGEVTVLEVTARATKILDDVSSKVVYRVEVRVEDKDSAWWGMDIG